MNLLASQSSAPPESVPPWFARLRDGIDRMVELLLRPERFFESELPKYRPQKVLGLVVQGRADRKIMIVAWITGMGAVIDRLDMGLLREQFGGRASGVWSEWPATWAGIVGGGVVSGFIAWYFWGWWCRVRARWAGEADPNPVAARVVAIWSHFVVAVPSIASVVVYTLSYPDYRTAFYADDTGVWYLLVFPFWSVVVSYRGAMTAFELNPTRARIWFLILPFIFYGVIVFGVMGSMVL